jgi:hypothetical protein
LEINEKWKNAKEIFYPHDTMEYEILDGLNEIKYLKFSNYDAITRNVYFPLRTIPYKE